MPYAFQVRRTGIPQNVSSDGGNLWLYPSDTNFIQGGPNVHLHLPFLVNTIYTFPSFPRVEASPVLRCPWKWPKFYSMIASNFARPILLLLLLVLQKLSSENVAIIVIYNKTGEV